MFSVFRGRDRSLSLVAGLAFFLLVSLCPTGIQGDQTCSCTGGCVPNQACESRTSCKKENVAYGKTTNISSIYINGDSRSTGSACVAVNGRTGHTLKYPDEPGTNCVHTASNDNNASWSVDLGRNYTVKDIVIYIREFQVTRLARIWIYVDNNICKKFPRNIGSGFELTYTAVCDSPLRGQIVNFTKKGPVAVPSDEKFINFCEVQIWVCKNGTFGQNCDRTCHCKDGSLCDNYYGTCTSGCPDGFYGDTCYSDCGHCLDDAVCDDGNGHCPGGCRTGYQPPYCNITCPDKTYGDNCTQTCGQCKDGAACNVFSGTCPTCQGNFSSPFCKVCLDGFYGDECRGCGHCFGGADCDKGNGHCPGGCQTGYEPPYCNTTCPDKIYGDNCAQTCGQCKDGAACNVFNGTCPTCQGNFSSPFCKSCLHGFYGDTCSETCGHCKDDAVCDASNGHCPTGCETGYAAPLCQDTCPDKTYGDNCAQTCGQCKDGAACNVFTGTCPTCQGNFFPPFCKGCVDGFYGDTCSEMCGQCKYDAGCDQSNGHCPNGCKAGYAAPLCKSTCPDKTYGDNCAQTCGQCKDGASCNVFNGTCPTCRGNFSPPFCKSCLAGFYGDACIKECGHCTDGAVCDASNGYCPKGCETEYIAPLCQDIRMPISAGTDVGTAVGTAVGVTMAVMVIVVSIIVVAVVVWLWRRKWVLPCADANQTPGGEEMEYKGTHATQQRGERDNQRDTGIYEIQDFDEPNTPSDLNRTPSDYEPIKTSDMGQKSVYSSLSPLDNTGGATGPSYVNKSETSPVYVNKDTA